MSLLSTTAGSVFINTTTRAGTVILPSTFLVPGRVVTLKDIGGSLATNNLRITTNNLNQTMDIGSFSTIVTDPFGWTTLAAGNNNKWYTIGGTQMHTVTASTIQSVFTNASNISTANIGTSTVAFQDRFSGSTNTLSMMSSLLYYSWRGTSGFQSTIVSGSRQATGGIFLPLKVPFSPLQIAALTLWLDAADLSTLIVSNNLVSQWNDKSRNGFNAIQTTPAKQGSYTPSRGIQMTTSAWYAINGSTGASYTKTHSMFIVATPSTAAGYFVGRNPAGGGGPTIISGFVGTLIEYYDSSQRYTFSSSPTLGRPFIACYSRTQGGNIVGSFNGSVVFTQLQTNDNGTVPGWVYLNSSQGDAYSDRSNSIFYEVIIYSAALTASQVQQVEGYLAWKWGLVANLPSNHPYKFIPP